MTLTTHQCKERWLQQQRDRYIDRPSNAKYRCSDCAVEVKKHTKRCGVCGARKPVHAS